MNQPPQFTRDSDDRRHRPSKGSPGPLPHWRRPVGVAEGTWDYVNERSIADHYDAFVADTPLCQLDQSVLRDIFPGSDASCPQTILDLGCGSGRSAIPLAERGYCVVAIDLSQFMLEVLARKATSLGEGRVLPLRANLVELDSLADQCADHAICLFSTLGMIQGREHRRTMLRHVARAVRPGGQFLIHVHHRWAALREYHGARALLRSWWCSRRDRAFEFGDTTYAYRGLEGMFMHRFSKRELLRDLTSSGWQIAAVWPVSIDGSQITSRWAIAGGFLVHAHR